MKTAKKTGFLEWNNDILASSIKKIGLNIFLIAILDILFYLLSGYFAILWLQRIQAKMAAFSLPTDVVSLGYDRAQQLIGEARSFYYLIIVSFALLLVAVIFLASIFKGVIWAKTTNTKITMKLVSKFLLLNLIWMGFWFALIILISLFVEPSSAPMFMIVTIGLGIYFTSTLYTIFMKEQKLSSILSAVRLNITKVHMFLLPYAAVFLLLFVILMAGNLLKFQYSSIILGAIVIFYAAFARYYLSALAAEANKL